MTNMNGMNEKVSDVVELFSAINSSHQSYSWVTGSLKQREEKRTYSEEFLLFLLLLLLFCRCGCCCFCLHYFIIIIIRFSYYICSLYVFSLCFIIIFSLYVRYYFVRLLGIPIIYVRGVCIPFYFILNMCNFQCYVFWILLSYLLTASLIKLSHSIIVMTILL